MVHLTEVEMAVRLMAVEVVVRPMAAEMVVHLMAAEMVVHLMAAEMVAHLMVGEVVVPLMAEGVVVHHMAVEVETLIPVEALMEIEEVHMAAAAMVGLITGEKVAAMTSMLLRSLLGICPVS